MSPLSGYEKVKLYRQRKKEGVSAPTCKCGRKLRGYKARHRDMCSECFRKTKTARFLDWARARNKRGQPVTFVSTQNYESWSVGQKVRSPVCEGKIIDIRHYPNDSILVELWFENEVEDYLCPEDMGAIAIVEDVTNE